MPTLCRKDGIGCLPVINHNGVSARFLFKVILYSNNGVKDRFGVYHRQTLKEVGKKSGAITST